MVLVVVLVLVLVLGWTGRHRQVYFQRATRVGGCLFTTTGRESLDELI